MRKVGGDLAVEAWCFGWSLAVVWLCLSCLKDRGSGAIRDARRRDSRACSTLQYKREIGHLSHPKNIIIIALNALPNRRIGPPNKLWPFFAKSAKRPTCLPAFAKPRLLLETAFETKGLCDC